MSVEDETPRAWERAIPLVVALASAGVAIEHVRSTSDATHDEGVIRVVGLGSAGIWRALDAVLGAPALALPWSTTVARAAVMSALGCGVAAWLLYVVARRLLMNCASATWLGPLVAAIAAWTATLGAAWQTEACSVGGSTWGALLPLISIAILAQKRMYVASFPVAALACGLALSYEPIVGLAAIGAGIAVVLFGDRRPTHADFFRAAPLFFFGVVAPIVFSLWRRAASLYEIATPTLARGWLGTVDLTEHGDLTTFAHAELGWVALALTGVGIVLACLVPRARPLASAAAILLAAGAVGIFFGAPAGPDRYAASPLVAIAAANILAAVAMQALVRAVARAKVPFAHASAVMIVVLELTFPAIGLDDSSIRAITRKNKLGSRWDDEALADLPAGAIVLVSDSQVMRHLFADEAAGAMRRDVVFLSLQEVGGRTTLHALAQEPKLAPIVRDVALTGTATEFSLATLAESRPLYVQYDSKWDRSLARHLVPAGVFDRFEPEPHGVTDRKRALEAFLPLREKLAHDVASPRDPEMTAITASLMRARLDALVAIDEREVLPRAIDDLRAFAPDDPIANRLVLKLVASRFGK